MNIWYFYITEQVRKKAIHVTHCPTEEMIGDFFTKPLQDSLFIKMRNYVMGNEEPGCQALPRSVLNNHDTTDIRKQKIIGTRKHNPEARKASHEYVGKDSDGSTKDVLIKNIHGTSLHTMGGDKGSIGGDDAKEKRHGEMSSVVEPRSYRDVLMNGKERQTMT